MKVLQNDDILNLFYFSHSFFICYLEDFYKDKILPSAIFRYTENQSF